MPVTVCMQFVVVYLLVCGASHCLHAVHCCCSFMLQWEIANCQSFWFTFYCQNEGRGFYIVSCAREISANTLRRSLTGCMVSVMVTAYSLVKWIFSVIYEQLHVCTFSISWRMSLSFYATWCDLQLFLPVVQWMCCFIIDSRNIEDVDINFGNDVLMTIRE